MAASGEVSWLGACMTVPREPPVWLVCSATPLRPGTLVGWLRTDLSPPLLLIDSILTNGEVDANSRSDPSDPVLGRHSIVGSCVAPSSALKPSGETVILHAQPLRITTKTGSHDATLIRGSLSYLPSVELHGHVALCARVLARYRSTPRPLGDALAGLQRVDLLQRLADYVASSLPHYVAPNLHLARSYVTSPTTWLGDRLLGLVMALLLFASAPALAALLVTALTTFLRQYHTALEYFIASGIGPGVWGVKLNAALVGSVGRLWRDYTSLLATVLPHADSPVWPTSGLYLVQGVSVFMAASGGWAMGVCLFLDVARLLLVPLSLVQRVVSLLCTLQLSALLTLGRLLIGRKYNPLRLRVDSHDFDMEHYTLGTVLFTLLFFLLPTIVLMHAFVSAPLLLVVQPVLLALRALAYIPSRVPLPSLALWIVRSDRLASSVSLRTTAEGLELRPQLPSLGAVLAPAFDLASGAQ